MISMEGEKCSRVPDGELVLGDTGRLAFGLKIPQLLYGTGMGRQFEERVFGVIGRPASRNVTPKAEKRPLL
jgi:hypothetical protein